MKRHFLLLFFSPPEQLSQDYLKIAYFTFSCCNSTSYNYSPVYSQTCHYIIPFFIYKRIGTTFPCYLLSSSHKTRNMMCLPFYPAFFWQWNLLKNKGSTREESCSKLVCSWSSSCLHYNKSRDFIFQEKKLFGRKYMGKFYIKKVGDRQA